MSQATIDNSALIQEALQQNLIDVEMASQLLREAAELDASMPVDVKLVARGIITPAQREHLLSRVETSNDLTETKAIRARPAVHAAPSAPITEAGQDQASAVGDVAKDAATNRYLWRQELARGGLGEVWQGWDDEVQRTVALKTLLPDAARSRRMRSRFIDEARITAQLEHPGVVPVYGLGDCERGPFYAMRVLEGQTLSGIIGDYQQLDANSPVARVKLNELLRIFASVCNTVAYAHQRRVLHRDLKPSNVMLGDFGEVLVVDWGLAKELAPSQDAEATQMAPRPDHASAGRESASRAASRGGSRTIQGEVLGTPLYMSPEQAAGRVHLTPQSDIFSLGVMLYEILTGAKAFLGADTETIIENVRRVRFAHPSKVARVPKPLEAICLRAMAADPQDRYATAAELARDVHHYLAGEAVSAYEESTWEWGARWCRRNIRSVAGAMAGTVLVAALAVSAAIFIDQARRDAKEAHQLELEARKREQQARQLESQARKREEDAKRWAFAQMQRTRESADAWLLDWSCDLQFYPGLEQVRANLLRQAVAHYEQCVDDAKRQAKKETNVQPNTVLETVKSLVRLGDARRLLHEPNAKQAFEEANRLLQPLLNSKGLSRAGAEILHLRATTGLALCALDSKDGEEQLRGCRTLAELMEGQQPASVAHHAALAHAWTARARLSQALGRHEDADKAYGSAQQAFGLMDSSERRHQSLRISVLLERAQLAMDQQRWREAESSIRTARDEAEKLVEASPRRPDAWESLAICELLQGTARERREGPRAGAEHYRRSLEHYRQMLECLYGDQYLNENIAVARINLARSIADDAPREAKGHLLLARDELVQMIRRNGADTHWLGHLERCLLELRSVLGTLGEDAADVESLLHSVRAMRSESEP